MGRGLSPLQHAILRLAVANREADTEPHPVAYRVTISGTTWEWHDGRLHRNPIDVRRLAPEAFTEADPDGYWAGDSAIVGSFADYDRAHACAEELRGRGVGEVPPYRGQPGLVGYVHQAVIRHERQDEDERRAHSARILARMVGKEHEPPDPRHDHGTLVPDVYGWEVLTAVCGLPLRHAVVPQPPPGFPQARFARDHWDRLGRHRPGRFEKRECPGGRYNVAHVSAHRAIDRLAQRGLVAREAGGFNLTETGLAVAQGGSLTAKILPRAHDLALTARGAAGYANG